MAEQSPQEQQPQQQMTPEQVLGLWLDLAVLNRLSEFMQNLTHKKT